MKTSLTFSTGVVTPHGIIRFIARHGVPLCFTLLFLATFSLHAQSKTTKFEKGWCTINVNVSDAYIKEDRWVSGWRYNGEVWSGEAKGDTLSLSGTVSCAGGSRQDYPVNIVVTGVNKDGKQTLHTQKETIPKAGGSKTFSIKITKLQQYTQITFKATAIGNNPESATRYSEGSIEVIQTANKPVFNVRATGTYVPVYGTTAKLAVVPPDPAITKVVWQSSPNLEFEPMEGKTTQVLFTRLDTVKIWALVTVKTKEGLVTVETPQLVIPLTPPRFTINFVPQVGRVGSNVTATITTSPSIPARLVDYRWFDPPSSERNELDKNGSRISFTPKKPGSLPITVLARVPHFGDTLANIKTNYLVQAATPPPATNLVRIVVVGAGYEFQYGGTNTNFVTFQQILLRANVQGYKDQREVRWTWTVGAGTTLHSSGLGQEIHISRSAPGLAFAKVVARTASGNIIGTNTVTIMVQEQNTNPLGRLIVQYPRITEFQYGYWAIAVYQKGVVIINTGATKRSVVQVTRTGQPIQGVFKKYLDANSTLKSKLGSAVTGEVAVEDGVLRIQVFEGGVLVLETKSGIIWNCYHDKRQNTPGEHYPRQ